MQSRMWLTATLTVLAFSAVAQADRVEEQRCEVHGEAAVSVKNVAGSVSVTSWDKNEVYLKASLGSGVERLDFVCSEGNVRIEVVVPKRNARNASAKLDIWLPAACSLTANLVSADLDVLHVTGDLKVQSVSGKLKLEGVSSRVDASTVSGDIQISGDADEIRAQAISGEITITANSPRLSAQTVSGGIEARGNFDEVVVETISGEARVDGVLGAITFESVSGNLSASTVGKTASMQSISAKIELWGQNVTSASIETISGSIGFEGSIAPHGWFEATTKSGGVTLKVPASMDAAYDLHTFSGGISNDFGPEAQKSQKYGPGKELRFSEGGGAAKIETETHSGSIQLKRQ